MDFTVERTASEADGSPIFTLRNAQGTSLLRAEQAQGPPPEDRRQIRLARPSGRVVATIDLPQPESLATSVEKRTDYAIIHDFAVYAILSLCRRTNGENEGGPAGDYYLLEVEGETWLALPDQVEEACYVLYDEVPAGLHTYETLTELDLPDSIGRLCRKDNEPAIRVTLAPRRLRHTDLILLALGLLIDRSGSIS